MLFLRTHATAISLFLCTHAAADCGGGSATIRTRVDLVTSGSPTIVAAATTRAAAEAYAETTFRLSCLPTFEQLTYYAYASDFDQSSSGAASVSLAIAGASSADPGDILGMNADAKAETRNPGSGYEIELTSHASWDWYHSGCTTSCGEKARGYAIATSSAQYEIQSSTGGSFFYSYNPRLGGSGIFFGHDGVVRVVGYIRPRPSASYTIVGIQGAQDASVPTSMIYDSGMDEWSASSSIGGIVGDVVVVGQLRFSDAAIDVNGDGRLNDHDIGALSAKISSVDPDDEKWDFDGDGSIGTDDVDLLDAIITAGFGSGLLGDADQDGLLECSDIAAISAMSDSTFGDVDYLIEVDANLDGLIDSADRLAACRAVQPADRNCDGVVDFSDYLQFMNEYGSSDPQADINGDGIVDGVDLLDFLNWYDQGC